MISNTRKLIELSKQVLGGPLGEELLKVLEEEHSPSYSENPNYQYYNIGKFDLIKELKWFVNAKESDIDRLEDPDSYNN